MISVKEFIETLNAAHDVPNYYCNKPGKNLGNFDGKRYSFDCWNLIKVILSGWKPTGIPGSKGNTKVTGDVDGKTLLSSCSNQSTDFASLSVPGTYLYLSTNPHAGIFVGEFSKDGKTYNVIECTKGMYAGQDGVTYSYVDKDGTRRAWKGGNAKLRWTNYGLLSKYVDYGNVKPAEKPKTPAKRDWLEKGDEGPEVVNVQQALLNKGYDPKGIDGIFGANTEKAVKAFQKANGLDVDGKVGPKTKEKLYKDEEVRYHTVKSGETLSKICDDFDIPMSEILRLNPDIKNPDKIYRGQKIRIK